MHNTCFRAISSVYGRIDHLLLFYEYSDALDADILSKRIDAYRNIYGQLPNHIKYFFYVLYTGPQPDFQEAMTKVQTHKKQIAQSAKNRKEAEQNGGAVRQVAMDQMVQITDVEIQGNGGAGRQVTMKQNMMIGEMNAGVQQNGEPDTRRITMMLVSEKEASAGMSDMIRRKEVSGWLQDYFFALESENDIPALLEQIQFRNEVNARKLGNTYIADVVASETDFFLKPFPYEFESGQILVGDDYMIVSETVLQRNKKYVQRIPPEERDAYITEAFRAGFGIPHLLWFPDALLPPDPLGSHLDMFLTLGGKVSVNGEMKELILLAEAVGPDESRPGEYNSRFREIEAYLTKYHEQGLSFKVDSIPLVLENSGETIVPRTFNNCLVEVYDRQKNAYLPSYTDGEGNSLYPDQESRITILLRKYGFSVTWIKGSFTMLANDGGSLHCVTNVLKRSISGRNWYIPYSYKNLDDNGNQDGLSLRYLVEHLASPGDPNDPLSPDIDILTPAVIAAMPAANGVNMS